jgi:hypothetical protein
MSNTNTGGPAFPSSEWDAEYERTFMAGGMTLRDYFAAKAMQGTLASMVGGEEFHEEGCKWAYQVADWMLKARDA